MANFFGFIGIKKHQWLLQELIIRDLKTKYRRSILGYLWSVLNPLMIMIVLTIIFSNMFRFDIPNFPVYLLSGQLLFGFFAESTSLAMTSILGGASLIKKVYLPKYIFPLSRVLSCFTTTLFSLVALFLVMIITGLKFEITIVMIPLILLYTLVFCLGMSLFLSVLVIYFRDTQHLYGVFLTALNYLTPIFYPAEMLPDWLKPLMVLNPMFNYVQVFRKVTLYGIWPSIMDHVVCAIWAISILVFGGWIFNKYQKNFILYI